MPPVNRSHSMGPSPHARRWLSFLYRPTTARVLSVFALGYAIYYLAWRATCSLNPDNLLFSLLFLGAEAYVVLNFVLYVMMTWDVGWPSPFVSRRDLRVDIFVATYNEDLDILEATLTGCEGIRYPHVSYVLDDGRRGAVAELAARLKCRYLTRGDNAHAKAGNINAALSKTDGEFIAILDADTVPQPDFLDRTLGYFVDPRVALVQLPQEFYNRDSLQHPEVSNDWHEQALFYRVIQPGKNRWNAAFWCGSPSVVRRAALDDVGGVATETVTEDLHTSVRLHARGWKTVFHKENLAYGIAPQTLVAFTVQRLRWAQGSMQLLRSRENPLILTGLTLAQRLNYLASMLPYFDPIAKLIFHLTPVIILVTDWLPLRIGLAAFALHWTPYLILTALANVALGRGAFDYLAVEKYNFLKGFTFLRAQAQLLRTQRLQFKVTPKHEDDQVYAQERRLLLPHFVVIVAEVTASVVGVYRLVSGETHPFDAHIIWIAAFWAAVNVGLTGLMISTVLRRLHRRKSYRFPISVRATIDVGLADPPLAEVRDLSIDGIGLRLTAPVSPGTCVRSTLHLPDGELVVGGIVVLCRRVRAESFHVGVQFGTLEGDARRRLTSLLFVVAPRLQDVNWGRAGRPTEAAAWAATLMPVAPGGAS